MKPPPLRLPLLFGDDNNLVITLSAQRHYFMSSSFDTSLCCIAEKDNNADVWKYNLLLFFSFYQPKCTCALSERERERERESRRRPRRTLTEWTVRFFCETTMSFCFWSKSSQVYIIFWTSMQILVVTPATYTLYVDTPLSSMPPTRFTGHFCWAYWPSG